MSEGYDTSSIFDGMVMDDHTRNELNHRVRMHVWGQNKRIVELEKERDTFRDMADGYGKLDAEFAISQARLSEAVKVLEEMADLLEGGESGFVSCSGPDEVWKRLRDQSVSKARQFLATLGEENEA